jgi:uncharacterized RmlC-like cupin family protein
VKGVRRVGPEERTPGRSTPGMVREEAFSTEQLWCGLVRTRPGKVSGWHHHGEYDTAVYVLTGMIMVESGPGGSDRTEAGSGDFLLIPKGVVHRESNPSEAEFTAAVVRAGRGEPVFNVDGPDSSMSRPAG